MRVGTRSIMFIFIKIGIWGKRSFTMLLGSGDCAWEGIWSWTMPTGPPCGYHSFKFNTCQLYRTGIFGWWLIFLYIVRRCLACAQDIFQHLPGCRAVTSQSYKRGWSKADYMSAWDRVSVVIIYSVLTLAEMYFTQGRLHASSIYALAHVEMKCSTKMIHSSMWQGEAGWSTTTL